VARGLRGSRSRDWGINFDFDFDFDFDWEREAFVAKGERSWPDSVSRNIV